MGAVEFRVVGKGKSAREAFSNLVKYAKNTYGHGGYTGTIAEKNNFKLFPTPKEREVSEYVDELLNSNYEIQDKWGPAGCIQLQKGKYLFFGWTSW